MGAKSFVTSWGEQAARGGRQQGRSRTRPLRFEWLEGRQMLAADFGWQAAESSKFTDDAETAAVAEQFSATETASLLKGAAADGPSLLLQEGSQAPSYASVGTLRTLQDYEAIAAGGDRAAGLPEQDHEAVDPLTMAGQLLGPRSSRPPLPGLPGAGGRGETLAGMLETFRRAGSSNEEQDSQQDPFARIGWAQDRSYWDRDGNFHSETTMRTTADDGWETTHITFERGGEIVLETTTLYDNGDVDYKLTVVDSGGERIGGGEMLTEDEEPAESDNSEGDDQPNPEDDSGGLRLLRTDPWALFLAWYTGQRSSKPTIPGCDNPGGLVEGQGQGSAAPGVGLEAVINPVDPLWGTSGGGGGDGSLPTLGCPTPVGPPRWM
jgi:hypothetical protein